MRGLLSGLHQNAYLGMQRLMALLQSHQACGEKKEEPLSILPSSLWVLISPELRPVVLGQMLGLRTAEPVVPACLCGVPSLRFASVFQRCMLTFPTPGELHQAAHSWLSAL